MYLFTLQIWGGTRPKCVGLSPIRVSLTPGRDWNIEPINCYLVNCILAGSKIEN